MGEALWPYERVLAELRAEIENGELTGKLPTRAQLAEKYGFTHMTVQKAIDALKKEGLVYSKRGLGVYVKEKE